MSLSKSEKNVPPNPSLMQLCILSSSSSNPIIPSSTLHRKIPIRSMWSISLLLRPSEWYNTSNILGKANWEKKKSSPRIHPTLHTHKFHYFPFLGRPLLLTLKFIASFFSSRTSPPCARLAVMIVDECKFQSFRFNLQEKKNPESSSCVHDESFAPLLRSRTVPKVDSAGEIEKKSWNSFFFFFFFPWWRCL